MSFIHLFCAEQERDNVLQALSDELLLFTGEKFDILVPPPSSKFNQ